MLSDLRYAIRCLRRSPGFTLVAVFSLGLALALDTTTFSILDAVRHPWLPVKDPAHLFQVREWGDGASGNVTGRQRLEVLKTGTFFESLALYTWSPSTFQVGDSAGDGRVTLVGPNFFSVLGVKAEQGRTFQPGAPEDLALISHQLWERWLGGRPFAGERLWVDGRAYRIAGVMPPAMTFPYGAGVWIQLPRADAPSGPAWVFPVVRLKRSVSREAVETELATLAARLDKTYGVGKRGAFAFQLRSLTADADRNLQMIHLAMGGAAAAVLFIACANLASLMLARGLVRRRELAIRLALGAGRRALIRQLLVESVLLAAAGGAVGIVGSFWAVDVVAHHLPPYVEWVGITVPHLGWRSLVFELLATAFTILLFGLLPAIRASDVHLADPLKDNAGTTTGKVRSHYNPIVIGEVTISLILLMAAALLTKAAGRIRNYSYGFNPRGLYRVSLRVASRAASADSAMHLSHNVAERLRRLDGVRSVASLSWVVPDHYTVTSDAFDGQEGYLLSSGVASVSPEFFRTLGVPIIKGRDFLPGDEQHGAVIVESDAVRALWPGGDVIGRSIKLGDEKSGARWVPVVGVVPRISLGFRNDPDLPTQPGIFLVSKDYAPPRVGIIIRTSRSDGAMFVALRQEIAGQVNGRFGGYVRPWLEGFQVMLAGRRFLVRIFGVFGALALALAAIGLYGVLAYTVGQRMREFAVRIALGAEHRHMVRLVLHDGAVMLLAGTAAGAFAAMATAGVLESWLYDVFPTDALSLVTAEAVLVLTGLAACVSPARRAMRADPVEILRAS